MSFLRFNYNNFYGTKIGKHVSYPEYINLRPYMSETQVRGGLGDLAVTTVSCYVLSHLIVCVVCMRACMFVCHNDACKYSAKHISVIM